MEESINSYICTSCHAIFLESELQDNDEGICDYCEHPLVKMESHTFKERSDKQELELMIFAVTKYNLQEVYDNIEEIDNWMERVKYRQLFWQALKITNKKFELEK
jgi:DNA-directed RNA polymerase subunit RPC12/RpoP